MPPTLLLLPLIVPALVATLVAAPVVAALVAIAAAYSNMVAAFNLVVVAAVTRVVATNRCRSCSGSCSSHSYC